jgi:hypothetical protein
VQRVDGRPIPGKNELRLFCVGWNEARRIPFFLKHYFSIGVDRVFYVDNGSTDDSLDRLLAHDNVHVWSTDEKLDLKSKYGISWIDRLLEKYGEVGWSLIADLDEILLFPGYETSTLQEVVGLLDKEGADCALSSLIDMYPAGPLSDAVIEGNSPWTEVCPFFEPLPGVRKRIFGLRHIYSKVHLFRWHRGLNIYPGFHCLRGQKKISSRVFSTLHFKFTSAFDEYVRECVARGVQCPNYLAYQSVMNSEGDLTLYDPDVSIRFGGTDQLIKMGYMSDGNAENMIDPLVLRWILEDNSFFAEKVIDVPD